MDSNNTLFGNNIEVSVEFMNLIGINQDDLSTPMAVERFKEIVQYFSKFPNPRYELLKILNKKPGIDNFEMVYNYVQLVKEQQSEIASLDLTDFTKEVQSEISNGYITIDTINTIQAELKKLLDKDPENEKYLAIKTKLDSIKRMSLML